MGQIEGLTWLAALLAGVLGGVLVTGVGYLALRRKSQQHAAVTQQLQVELKTLIDRVATLTEPPRLEPHHLYFAERPVQLAATEGNVLALPSDFLHWERCTLLAWVNVPANGQGLRQGDADRYLLAHMTSVANPAQGWPFYNRFSFGYMAAGRVWALGLSSSQSAEKYLGLTDRLEAGWHQFLLAWDHTQPIVDVVIDGGAGGQAFATDLQAYWPDRLAAKVMLGAWVGSWTGSYCEAAVYHVAIFDAYLALGSPQVRAHAQLKPTAENPT